MADGDGRVPLYRYGPVAWVWRVLLALVGVGCAAVLVATSSAWQAWLVVGPLLLPGAFFGFVVASRIDLLGDRLHVVTLCGLRRNIARDRLGVPVLRLRAYADGQPVHAPRWWVPVRGGLPLHVDLLGTIVDERAVERVFGARSRR